MHQPLGFRGPVRPDHVCLLRKFLYGLKQAPRAWCPHFADFVTTILSKLSKEFSMKDLGPLNCFLGIFVSRTLVCLFLSQQEYTAGILKKAAMSHCKPAPTLVTTSSKLCADAGSPYDNPTLYRSLAEALRYLTFTCPDIFYAVQQVCLFMHDPRVEHIVALHRILWYVQGTLDHGVHLYKSSISSLLFYTNADWGGCPDTHHSTTGYYAFLGDNLISWSAKRQPIVSKSSAEAEYRGVANVVFQSCWIHSLLLELHCPIPTTTLVYCDNVNAVYLSSNPVQHQHTKHIEMNIDFVRE